jgi:hypothetical protein
VFAHLFERPDGDRIAIAWVTSGATSAVLDVGRNAAVAEYMLDGTRHEVRVQEGVISVDLSAGTPRIFRLSPR